MEQTSGQRSILLVEDHRDTLMLQAMFLQRAGYKVLTAETADAALEQAAAHEVHLIVSDLRLPDRNGSELMRELYERHGLRGVALTGAADEGEAAVQSNIGFVRVLVKPVAPAEVVQAVQSVLSDLD